MRKGSAARAAAGVVLGLAVTAGPHQAAAETEDVADDTLKILSVDARTMPGMLVEKPAAEPPAWRTSFGSERRSELKSAKPKTAVDADIVMLQGVTDARALRQWFPAGQWRLVVSNQFFVSTPDAPDGEETAGPTVPTTAVAIRLRRGLRVTGQQHLLELADALGDGSATPTAAGTAVRVLIDGRETWAVSVLLPDTCGKSDAQPCPGLAALERWHAAREAEGIRRVTGGRFAAGEPANAPCGGFGLRLDPPPPPPKARYTAAAHSATLGCTAAIMVAK